MDRIIIENLEVFARHGVFPEENVLGQKFLFSLTLWTDTRRAGISDALEDSVNYGEVCHLVQEYATSHTFRLLEALAENLCRIEPSLELELHSCRLTAENMPAIFSGCDIVVECFDDPDSKMTLIRLMSENGRTVVAASGIAGWGKSNAVRLRNVGGSCYLVGDLSSGIAENLPPFSPRVGIAAAVQANTVLSILLEVEP